MSIPCARVRLPRPSRPHRDAALQRRLLCSPSWGSEVPRLLSSQSYGPVCFEARSRRCTTDFADGGRSCVEAEHVAWLSRGQPVCDRHSGSNSPPLGKIGRPPGSTSKDLALQSHPRTRGRSLSPHLRGAQPWSLSPATRLNLQTRAAGTMHLLHSA